MFKLKYHTFLVKKVSSQFALPQTISVLRNFKRSAFLSNANLPDTNQNIKENVKKHSDSETSWGDYNKIEREKQFVVRLKVDPDWLRDDPKPEYCDEGDLLEDKHFTEQPLAKRKLRTKQYADIIKEFIRKRQIKEAIDVLEIRMLKEDRVKPEPYIYNLLLGACGRVGYTKKAFMLYNQMKQRGLSVMGGTYTALFNACANSPWPTTDGLSRAKHLYNIMIEKGYQPNDTNYHAMIKAFGKCGDLPMAFKIVDDMHQQELPIKGETINFLFHACISDKEAGFRHALLVWRKLMDKKIAPDIYSFNLLLRCVRDCGLGDIDSTEAVIRQLVHPEGVSQQQLVNLIEPTDKDQEDCKQIIVYTEQNPREGALNLRPNLLALKPHLGNIMSLSEVKSGEHRLLLLGGCRGFLDTMAEHKCTPDIKTFTQLLDVVPGTTAAEKELVAYMKKVNIRPDLDFFNMLIRKKSMRCDYERAKEVLLSLKNLKYRPNLVTYGLLALGCKTKEEALDLLSHMNKFNYTLNSAILGAMLHQACYHRSYDYIFEVMELCLKESIPVNKKFLEHLEEFKKDGKKKLEAKEFNPKEAALFIIFLRRLKTWLTEVQIDETDEAHPWQQYRQTVPKEISEKYVSKDTARFKQRHTSLFKVKTSQKSIQKTKRKSV